MKQEIIFSIDARRRLISGLSIPVRAIATANGPSGRGAIFHYPPAVPEIVFHGLAIAREFRFNDSVERQGGVILYETMHDFNHDFGDGSSSLALITHGILVRSLPFIYAGYSPACLADALLDLGRLIHSEIQAICTPFTDNDCSIAVARSAAGGEVKVAEEVVSILNSLGQGGYVTIKEAHGSDTYQKILPGMVLPAGLISLALKMSNSSEADYYYNPYILLCDDTIEDFGCLTPILEGFAQSGKPLVIFARNIIGSALGTLVVNVQKAGLKVAAIAVPEVGNRIYETLEDIAALTGGEVVSKKLGHGLQSMKPHMLGQAECVEVSTNQCVLTCKPKDLQRLEARKQTIHDEISRMRYLSYDKEKLETRLARLSGGVAEVYVGAHSVLEQKQKIHCYQKALKALQSAQRSGVVPGGGSAYRYVASRLERQHGNGYSDVVAKMLTEGLRVPERQLVKSVDGNPLLLRASTDECSNQSLPVFDVGRRAYIDSKKAGILDSAEITEEVVKRSISLAATMMRSDVCITNR